MLPVKQRDQVSPLETPELPGVVRLSLLSRSLSSVPRAGPKAHSPCVLRGDNLSTNQADFQVSPATHCLFGDRLQNLSSFVKPALVSPNLPHSCHRDQGHSSPQSSGLLIPEEILDPHAQRCGGTHSRLCGAEFLKTAFWKFSPAGLQFLGLIPDGGVNSPRSPMKSPAPASEPASPPPPRVSIPGLAGEQHQTPFHLREPWAPSGGRGAQGAATSPRFGQSRCIGAPGRTHTAPRRFGVPDV